jgi:protein-tyrosine kinase
MREVDQALARVYAHRGSPSEHEPAARRPSRATASGPHFSVASTPTSGTDLYTTTGTLRWPATVRALERAHGDRFDKLADYLIDARDNQRLKVLLFTSCHRAEGRTTLVLTLARALARRPGRTLLVDADLTGPMVARHLGLHAREGLDDLIENGHALADALIHAPDDHLTILPLRAPVARPKDFLASPAWSCLMARLRREFDLVLMDGSPLFAGLSAAVLHRSVDAAILVHHRALTGERALLRAREVLEAGGIPLLGLAETFV